MSKTLSSIDAPLLAARPGVTGLPCGAVEALADPIVQAMMAAGRVDPHRVEALLRHVAGRLARASSGMTCTVVVAAPTHQWATPAALRKWLAAG